VGAIGVASVAASGSGSGRGPDLSSSLVIGLISLGLGYVIGVTPAALTGGVLGLLDRPQTSLPSRLARAAAVGAGLTAEILALTVYRTADDRLYSIATVALTGAGAAVCCLLLIDALRRITNADDAAPT
jgi:hypothetical protein